MRYILTFVCLLALAGVASAQEQKPAQAPVQKAAPIQAPTQKLAPVQAPTQKATQAPTQKAVQSPTQKPIQKGEYNARGGRVFDRYR